MKNFGTQRLYVIGVFILLIVLGLIYQSLIPKTFNDNGFISQGLRGEKIYENDKYGFSINIPNEWDVYEVNSLDETPAIFFYPKDSVIQPPFLYGQNELFIAIYPMGFSVGGKTGWEEKEVSGVVSYITSSGDAWGIEKRFNDRGIIFGSTNINNLEEVCMRGDLKILLRECNPVTDDFVIRTGNVNKEGLETIKKIIDSLSFNK